MIDKDNYIEKKVYVEALQHILNRIDRYFLLLIVVFVFYLFYGFIEPQIQQQNQKRFIEMDKDLRSSIDMFGAVRNLYLEISRPANSNSYQYLKKQIILIKNDEIGKILESSSALELSNDEIKFIKNYENLISSFIKLMEIENEKTMTPKIDAISLNTLEFHNQTFSNKKFVRIKNLVDLSKIVFKFKEATLSPLDFLISNKIEQFNLTNRSQTHINIGSSSLIQSFPLYSAISPYFSIISDTTVLYSYEKANSVFSIGYNILYINDIEEQIRSLNEAFEKSNDYYDSDKVGIPFSDWTIDKLLIILLSPLLIIVILHYIIFLFNKRLKMLSMRDGLAKREYDKYMKLSSNHFVSFIEFLDINPKSFSKKITQTKKLILGNVSKTLFIIPFSTLLIFSYNVYNTKFWASSFNFISILVYIYGLTINILLLVLTAEAFHFKLEKLTYKK